MFWRTRIQLTLLNSIVFAVFISMFGIALYSYMDHRLYRDVDRSLLRLSEHIQQGESLDRLVPFLRDPRLFIIIWNKNGEMMEANPGTMVFQKVENAIRPKKWGELYDVEIGPLYFRTIALKVGTNAGNVTVQLLRNVNSEKEMMGKLLMIMITGCALAIVGAVAAGYFLAGRALVPIQHAWQKQQQFVSDASHELRTPLSVIQAKTDLLFRSPTATIEEKIVDISVIAKECRRLSKLVTHLLTLARSDSNQIELKREVFRLDELMKEIANHYKEIAIYQQKEIAVEAASPIFFVGDKERMHQLLIILLDNAMKYTEEGGKISLTCEQSASSIILKVQDNGIGMAEEEIPKIFDRFYQGDKARTKTDGAGLGLSIAKWIIDKHHGKVKVHSRLGEGTVFELIFPKPRNVLM
ncbi:MAG: HAMP domain-containing histidine kinase [Anoxybacillus sp.]|nr:HAMP domain-containing sensor histidine kinase [Anoxybacillus sp.]MCL6585078.1 HAMP domain-containing histidine kinase [Anoxybacillus sp.]